MYFSLLNHCFLVSGKEKGVVYNLKERKAIELEKEEHRIVAWAERGNELKDGMKTSEVLLDLEKKGWGFFSENRYFVDKLRPYNSFTLTRPDLAPHNPQMAYLQLNHTCGIGADKCQARFCTPCRCTDESRELLTVEQWSGIAGQLYQTGAGTFFLTGGDVLAYEGLTRLCRYIRELGAVAVLVVNHPDERLHRIDKDIPLILYLCDHTYSQEAILAVVREFEQVTVLSDGSFDFGTDTNFNMVLVKNTEEISREDFVIPGVDEFYQRKDRDVCLYGKVFVLSNGDVVPCFRMECEKVGNLLRGSLKTIVHSLAEKYWRRDAKADGRCSGCEWFYACPSCRGMSANQICPVSKCI